MNKMDILKLLDSKNIPYEVTEHDAVYTIEDMLAAGIPHPKTIAKNLVVRDDKKRNYYLITVLENKRVDLKHFAEKYGTRKLSFASENDLMDILGLIKGAVTPFGLLNDTDHCVKFYLDSDFKNGILGIHPNDNTATVSMKTEDLVSLLADKGYETEWIDILS